MSAPQRGSKVCVLFFWVVCVLTDFFFLFPTLPLPCSLLCSVFSALASFLCCSFHAVSFVAITSGANMDFDRLRFVSERADATETFISVLIPERPGSFQELYSKIYPRNVTSFSYRYKEDTDAYIFMSFQTKRDEDKSIVLSELDQSGYVVTDLSENEMAKVHGRYLCGGRTSNGSSRRSSEDEGGSLNELLYRFEFPERPGALKTFLDTLSQGSVGWNVSLFHYRYHGADIGRVLVGVQVKEKQMDGWEEFLDDLGYSYHQENDNRVYRQFLK